MKTLALYAVGIPCVLAAGRIVGFDAAFTAPAAESARQVAPVNGPLPDAALPANASDAPALTSGDPLRGSDGRKALAAVVVPERSVRVESAATGVLRKVLVAPNQEVEEGQPLAFLDTREVEADIRQQRQTTLVWQSKRREAAGERRKAEAKLELRRPLLASGIVSAEAYHELTMEAERAAERVQQCDAEVARSEEEARSLQESLDRYVVSAPFSGVITRIDQFANQFVHEGDVILEMESSQKQVRALVPSKLSARLGRLRFQIKSRYDDRPELTVAAISPQEAIDGYQLVLFDLPEATHMMSNQPLTIYVDREDEPATAQPEPAESLAVR